MTELIENAFAQGHECLLGSVGADGQPQISPKGSVAVFSDTTLSFWERSHRNTERNLIANPRVTVYYRNADRMKEIPYVGGAMRFYGTARIVTDAAEREAVWNKTNAAEQSRDKDKSGIGVLIEVDRVEELNGNVIMAKNT